MKLFFSRVVWNPGHTATKMADLHQGGEREFVCVEATQTTEKILVKKDQSWKASHTLKAL